jgi:hypothetical protein
VEVVVLGQGDDPALARQEQKFADDLLLAVLARKLNAGSTKSENKLFLSF